MSLKATLLDDMKAAMKAGRKDEVQILRMLSAAIKQVEVDERVELDDARTQAIFEKQLKQRKESIAQFDKAGRDDLIAQEQAEAELIQRYLPEPMSDNELAELVDQVIGDTGASGMADMGKVMGQVKVKAAGRADMGKVSAQVKSRLA